MTNRVTKGNGKGSSVFRRLTRADLVTFDREAKDLILKAMEAGCLGRVSAKGHAILRNNTGGTTSVPRNMTAPNRSAQNARADMRRLLAEHRPTLQTPTSRRAPRPTQQMTVSQAFIEHGATFPRWFDALPGGLRADQLLKVSFDEADTPSFHPVPTDPVPCDPVPTADHEPETWPATSPGPESPRRDHGASRQKITPEKGQEAEADMSAEAQPTPQDPEPMTEPMAEPMAEAVPTGDASETVLQRVRAALGEDPRVSALDARVAELETALAQERERAEEAQSRLGPIQEAFHA